MRYFKLVSQFLLNNGNQNTLCIIQVCDDTLYNQETNLAILNARVVAKRMCGDIEPSINHVLTELTESEYLSLVPSQTITDLGDEEELNNEINS